MPVSFGVDETSQNLTNWGGRSYEGYLVTPDGSDIRLKAQGFKEGI